MHAQTHTLLTREQQLHASGECDNEGRPLARQVFFEPDNWLVPESYGDLLAAHAAWLTGRPEQRVLVSGHSYGTGSHRFFWLMGDRRAMAVRSALIKAGAGRRQVLIQSRGAARPLIELAGEEVAQYRRRVTLDYLDTRVASTPPVPPEGSAAWWHSVFGSGGKARLPADRPAAQAG
ncbi:OmpA family protein [Polaromonas sp.]|uniref:OmpA family protein n=1 Tax=Polaromonas sp. TaxID=1869339 RepID=UPI00248A5F87|nr:OmpA family protein [Polaromonas sp.]MDI1273822.1 OmpA family protein [Polaromonas sp.]